MDLFQMIKNYLYTKTSRVFIPFQFLMHVFVPFNYT